MRIARRLVLLAAFGLASASIVLAVPASAQQAPAGDGASRALDSSGSYNSTVTSGSRSFPRAGTYQAAVTFAANVALSGIDVAAMSGAYTANGPFTATVSAPDVAAFVVTGTFTASGTFSAGTFVSSGGWTLTSGGQASGTHQGGGTYNLSGSAHASGQYLGTVTDSARGPFGINGSYQGDGTYTPPPITVPTLPSGGGLPGGVNPIDQLTSAISSLAAIAASGPATATAIEMRALAPAAATPKATTTPTPSGGPVAAPGSTPPPGSFTGTVAPSGVSLALFTGSRTQLQAAATATNAVTLAATVGGRMLVYVVGAPEFVNTEFDVAFPTGFSGTPIIIRK